MGAQDVRTLFLAHLHFTQVAVEEPLGMVSVILMEVLVAAVTGLTTLPQADQPRVLTDLAVAVAGKESQDELAQNTVNQAVLA
jgi:hypothetical protein